MPVEMSRLSRFRPLLMAVLAVVIFCGAVSLWVYRYAVSPGPGLPGTATTVYIPPGSGVRGVSSALTAAGVIADDRRFILVARLMGVSRRLQAGEYRFPGASSPVQVLREMAAGHTVLRTLTIPEGSNLFQIAGLMEVQGWAAPQMFLDLAHSASFLKTLSISAPSLEGYLFPDTYRFARGEEISRIVTVMVARTRKVMAEECRAGEGPDFIIDCSFAPQSGADGATPPKIPSSGKQVLGPHEILTLASIVEKETGLAEERPLVAGVFLNRLAAHMKLQADPTVIYGLRKFDSPLRSKDLATEGPYNTYVNRGLPAGPICSPGRASVAAVFQADRLYTYFVAQGDGRHSFSKSLREHNKAVQRFRESRRVQEPVPAKQ